MIVQVNSFFSQDIGSSLVIISNNYEILVSNNIFFMDRGLDQVFCIISKKIYCFPLEIIFQKPNSIKEFKTQGHRKLLVCSAMKIIGLFEVFFYLKIYKKKGGALTIHSYNFNCKISFNIFWGLQINVIICKNNKVY